MDNQPVVQTTNIPITPTPPSSSGNYLKYIIVGIGILVIFISGGLFLGKTIYAPKTSPAIQPTVTLFQTATPTIIPTVDPTANWKTYTDTEKSFSFKYPNNFKIKQVKNVNEIFSDSKEGFKRISFIFTTGMQTNDGEDWSGFDILVIPTSGKSIMQRYEKINGPGGLIQIRPIQTNNNSDEAVKLINSQSYEVFKKNDNFYEITPFQNGNTLGTDNIWKYIDQILSTFKFADQNTNN